VTLVTPKEKLRQNGKLTFYESYYYHMSGNVPFVIRSKSQNRRRDINNGYKPTADEPCTLYKGHLPIVAPVCTVSVHVPVGCSPQQCVVIITQFVRPSPEVSAARRLSRRDRVPLGEVSASSSSPRRVAPSVTDT